MTAPLREALATALRHTAHEMRWCKSSDLWHVVAHGDDDDEPLAQNYADAILATEAMQPIAAAVALAEANWDLLEMAWGIIANAGGGDWTRETNEWQEAAARWRDRYHGDGRPERDVERAEHEAVGRAVARLPDHWTIARIGDKYVVLVFDDRDQMSALGSRSRAKAGSIPEAIVAALGPLEGERTEAVTGEPEREVEDERRRAYDGLDMPR